MDDLEDYLGESLTDKKQLAKIRLRTRNNVIELSGDPDLFSKYGQPLSAIPGSKMVRTYCLGCGGPMRSRPAEARKTGGYGRCNDCMEGRVVNKGFHRHSDRRAFLSRSTSSLLRDD